MRISGASDDREAKVGEYGLETFSTSKSMQHTISHISQNAFQTSGLIDIATSEKTVLVITNTSPTKKLVVTYLRLSSIGADAASSTAFFAIKVSGIRSSGGTAVTPVNMFAGSPKEAPATAYEGSGTDIVMNGSELEIDRNYTANAMQSYGKEGVLILDTNQSVSVTHIGSTVAGKAYARISFYME